ncbi:MAG TPA: hypothetical protein VIL85_20800 [Thermomicrobiales bacterium]|jgi:hypothetical protein
MRLERIDPRQQNGWWAGPWNSSLEVAVGWATSGINAPHRHRRSPEIYMVAHGEAHMFLSSSDAYQHFVIHSPAFLPDAASADHVSVLYAELGLA